MGLRFMLKWKWVSPIQSSPINNQPNKPHSSSFRHRESLFESARVSTLSIIPEENEIMYKDPAKPCTCSLGGLQTISNNSAAVEEMKVNFGKKKSHTGSSLINSISMPSLKDKSTASLESLPANNRSHFSFLMENLEKIEALIVDQDMIMLEKDILIQIERLGALKLFNACLSRTIKATNPPNMPSPLIAFSEKEHKVKITVCSRKKRERKSRRAKASEKSAKMSTLGLFPNVQRSEINLNLPRDSSQNRTRKHVIGGNESEMSRGIQEASKLEKIRNSLEEKSGRAASMATWAEVAGIDEKVLLQRLHFGWFCRDKLLRSTRPLVLYLAKNYRGRGIGFEDLIQAGCLGVLQGAERFDHTRGYQFSTYVQYWIRKSLSALVARHSRGILIPMTLNDAINQTRKARRVFYNSHGRYPNDEDVAKLTGHSLAKVRLANKCSRLTVSIDQRIGDELNVKFKEITADRCLKTPEETVMNQHMNEDIRKLLEYLHPRERQVLMLRYGISDGKCNSLAEIGKLFNVTKELIRKIEKAALLKLRKEEIQGKLHYYLEL